MSLPDAPAPSSPPAAPERHEILEPDRDAGTPRVAHQVRPTQSAGPRAVAAYAGLRAALSLPMLAGLGPSREAARTIGRGFGSAPFNRTRVKRAANHLRLVFPGRDDAWRKELVLRSYEHLAMLAVEVAFMPRLITPDGWMHHVEIGPMRRALSALLGERPIVLITGHCGNWEVVGASMSAIGFPTHVLYRPIDLKPLDDWVKRTRAGRGLHLMDKFGAAEKLPGLLERNERVAFVADQNAGDRGLFVPFFGRLTSTYKTIALLAVKYGATLVCGHARRLAWDDEGRGADAEGGMLRPGGGRPGSGPGAPEGSRRVGGSAMRYRIEIYDTIPREDYLAADDPVFYLTARYRRAIERMVIAAPEQYLWMHRIWKSRPRHERLDRPFPDALRRKLEGLPWLDPGGVESIVRQSDADRAFLKETGRDRLP